MRSLVVLRRSAALALIAPALVAAGWTPSATAAAEACEGQPATVVGTGEVTGTEGDDVIVALSPTVVNALGGSDLVCLGRRGGPTEVDAGAGNDRVVVADPAARQRISTNLGTGTDEYVGAATRDIVTDDDGSADDVRTGDGEDFVLLEDDGPVTETVHLEGDGGLVAVDGVVSDGSDLDGGARDEATLFLRDSGRVDGEWLPGWHIQNGAINGVARLGNRTGSLAFRDFGRFEMDSGVIESFVGGPRDDEVRIGFYSEAHGAGDAGIRYASLGGGDDYVSPLAPAAGQRPRLSYGGAGTDAMDVRLYEEEARYPAARADLARGLVTYGTGAQRVELARVRGMEVYDFDVNYQVDVTGSDRDETIRIHACRSTVKAGAGRDTLLLVGTGTEYCFEPALRFYGGRGSDRIEAFGATVYGGDGHDHLTGAGAPVYGEVGNDVLVGHPGADRLYGGAGRDRADGLGGVDTCRAEVLRRCER